MTHNFMHLAVLLVATTVVLALIIECNILRLLGRKKARRIELMKKLESTPLDSSEGEILAQELFDECMPMLREPAPVRAPARVSKRRNMRVPLLVPAVDVSHSGRISIGEAAKLIVSFKGKSKVSFGAAHTYARQHAEDNGLLGIGTFMQMLSDLFSTDPRVRCSSMAIEHDELSQTTWQKAKARGKRASVAVAKAVGRPFSNRLPPRGSMGRPAWRRASSG